MFPPVSPPCFYPCNPSCNPVVEALQNIHYCVRHNLYFTPIQKHRLNYRLIHHLPGLDWRPFLPQYILYHPLYPMSLPQVAIKRRPVTIILRDRTSEIWECGCCLEGVHVEPYFHPVCLKAPLHCLPPLVAFLYHPSRFRVIMEII